MVNQVVSGKPDYYLFVIDTDAYAGNFERQMCAYVTGHIGECEVGKEQAELARQEIPDVVARLEELIDQVPDEHGCARPVSIFPNPKHDNDAYSVAIYFHSIPDSGLLAVMEERAKNIASRGIGLRGYEKKVGIEGFRFLEQYTIYKELNL